MQKIFPLILPALVLTACSAPIEIAPSYQEDSEIYEYSVGESTVYFEHPISATITHAAGNGLVLNYGDCELLIAADPGVWPDADEAVDGDITYQSVFSETNEWVKYRAIKANVGVQVDLNIPGCMSLVNDVTRSMNDKPVYVNNTYGFSVNLLEDWRNDRYPERIVMKRTITPEKPPDFDKIKEKEQRPFLPFDVEIGVVAQNSDYENLSELIADRFPGYTVEFVQMGDISGVMVGDQLDDNSLRRFFFLSEDNDTVYEAYINVWNIHYNEFAATFEGVVSTIQLF